jgi:hypothetical protein
VSDDDGTALIAATAGQEHGLGEVETAALAAAREITMDTRMTDETWAATLQIDVEPDYERYLEAFPPAEGVPGPQNAR